MLSAKLGIVWVDRKPALGGLATACMQNACMMRYEATLACCGDRLETSLVQRMRPLAGQIEHTDRSGSKKNNRCVDCGVLVLLHTERVIPSLDRL
ncbi:hypothetical protein ElyMa_000926800 [Elysia marginata]|uniref:Uncharacterized protein n=1 Tax=Elysia marginata TaxID=1093978 RepID=A0AAV4HDD4_9GAST|nr:hypothetical protein ElyMa_000926800 [Elysia marginata]